MERVLSSHQFIRKDAERPHVCLFGTVRQLVEQFWTHVGWGPAVGLCFLSAETAERKGEVYQHDLSLFRDEHVVGLDVSMGNSDFVAVLQGQSDALHQCFCLVFTHRSCSLEHFGEGLAFEVLED